MLYISFRILVMITSIMGLFHMLANFQFEYIFFPISILIWGIFSFFDEEDKEYLRRNGINPDEVSWFFPEYTEYGYDHQRSYQPNKAYTDTPVTYTTYAKKGRYNNQEYKNIIKKCKRSVKVTINGKI